MDTTAGFARTHWSATRHSKSIKNLVISGQSAQYRRISCPSVSIDAKVLSNRKFSSFHPDGDRYKVNFLNTIATSPHFPVFLYITICRVDLLRQGRLERLSDFLLHSPKRIIGTARTTLYISYNSIFCRSGGSRRLIALSLLLQENLDSMVTACGNGRLVNYASFESGLPPAEGNKMLIIFWGCTQHF